MSSLAPVGNSLYVGGQFGTAGASLLTVNNVARWNGLGWSELGSGTNAEVNALAVAGNYLYVGGFHTVAGEKPSSHISCWTNVITGVGDTPAPARAILAQNVPNPFNPRTRIRYSVRVEGPVRLTIFDAAGRRIRTLVDAVQTPRGSGYVATWDGTNDEGHPVATGVYFYTLTTSGDRLARKMLLLK